MQETTRKTICRVAFVLACALPTAATCGLIVWRATPLHHRLLRERWESSLSAHCGATVRMEGVRRTREGTIVLRSIEWTDPETRQRIASARRVEIAVRSDGVVVLLQQPEVTAAKLSRLVAALRQRLRAAHPWPVPEVLLEADDLTLRAERRQDDRTLTELRCVLEPTASGARSVFEFRVAGQPMKDSARVRVTRERQSSPPSTAWEFQTGSAPLPCSVLSDAIGPLSALGDRATFRGSLWARHTGQAWDVDVVGRFDDVDLDRLVTDRFVHKLGGPGQMVFHRATFRDGRLLAASGTLHGGPGVVSRSLLDAAADRMGVKLGPDPEHEATPLIAYRELTFGFNIDADGLELTGQCAGGTPSTIMSDRHGNPLMISPEARQPLVGLVRALAPDNDIQVPASRETELLIRALPIPPIRRPERVGSRPPYHSLRLED